jgi:Glycosyltransferase involved in LPS biosynthesis
MKWVFFIAICFSSLEAEIENHLKKPKDKPNGCSIKNIDYIYVINLDQRPEKWQRCLSQLNSYDIHPYRFSAVNGWELSLETINDVGLKFSPEMEGGFMATSFPLDGNFAPSHELIQTFGQTYFCHCTARGTIGIALSHLSVLQDGYDSGYETIWVMEDDVDVKRDPNVLSDLIEKLDLLVGKENWDVLFTDRDIRGSYGNYVYASYAAKRPDFVTPNDLALKKDISPEFRKVGARYGAHSMIIRKSGMRKLLQFFGAHQIFLPYDLDYILPPGIQLYTVAEDIVANLPGAISDNGSPNYLNK